MTAWLLLIAKLYGNSSLAVVGSASSVVDLMML